MSCVSLHSRTLGMKISVTLIRDKLLKICKIIRFWDKPILPLPLRAGSPNNQEDTDIGPLWSWSFFALPLDSPLPVISMSSFAGQFGSSCSPHVLECRLSISPEDARNFLLISLLGLVFWSILCSSWQRVVTTGTLNNVIDSCSSPYLLVAYPVSKTCSLYSSLTDLETVGTVYCKFHLLRMLPLGGCIL